MKNKVKTPPTDAIATANSLLPILPLRGLVAFPETSIPLNVGQPRSVILVDDAYENERMIGLFASKDPEIQNPTADDIYRVGTIAKVYRLLRQPDGTMRMMVNAKERVRIVDFIRTSPYLEARVEPFPIVTGSDAQLQAMARNLADMFLRVSENVPSIPESLIASSLNANNPLQLAYTIATYLHLDLELAQQFLELETLLEKLTWLTQHIGQEIEIMEMEKQIRSEAFGQMERAQREYFLREQLKAIQRQLGEEDERQVEANEFRYKIENANMPEAALKEALREINRMVKLPVAAAEYSVVRNHLEWLTNLPWSTETADNLELDHARKILNEDHHGLEEIKQRIVEYLAVRRLKAERSLLLKTADFSYQAPRGGAILCFAGPPGVGKTSLGRSIARAMQRNFTRIAVGGVRDEAEIRGHRRTYIGAMPGRIIQALRQAGSRNPVIMLDEIDKLGSDFRGDPSSALLEVLDPVQNREFQDHYLDVPVDLSDVIFIATANTLDTIPSPLLDRMEILRLSGYTESEKLVIANRYLIPRQMRENGLEPEEMVVDEPLLRQVIHDYTREAGVRELERQIGRLCRKAALQIAAQPQDNTKPIQIEQDELLDFLGPAIYSSETAERTQIPGVATGLAWTSTGGSLMFVEVAQMPGQKDLLITGQVGDVMRESAYAALSYIRSQAVKLGIPQDFFDKHDLHVHLPAGAIPKDGPSAGITIATALASLLTGIPVSENVGMTGEITLRGQIMPIGGLKEKVLAAHRAGLKTIILPQRNKPDLEKIPKEIRQEMRFVLANSMSDVLKVALGKK